jgi:hypothetical protein
MAIVEESPKRSLSHVLERYKHQDIPSGRIGFKGTLK